jgi:DNA-binding GntR family transcriptional regulator
MARQSNVFKQAYNRALSLAVPGEHLASEPELCQQLGVSRTTVRAVLSRMAEVGIISWDKRSKEVLRAATQEDQFPGDETEDLSDVIEQAFMRRIVRHDAQPGLQINELELAREVGTGTTSVREFLIRFSRFGLIEKRRNSHWVLRGFTRQFALEVMDVREMFELRSAAAFASLPAADPAWQKLYMFEAEHRAMLADERSDPERFSELDENFHLLIQAAAGNRFIRDFYDVIAVIFHYHYRWNKTETHSRNRRALEEHLAYIEALKSRDPQRVSEACQQHMNSARLTLLQSISFED